MASPSKSSEVQLSFEPAQLAKLERIIAAASGEEQTPVKEEQCARLERLIADASGANKIVVEEAVNQRLKLEKLLQDAAALEKPTLEEDLKQREKLGKIISEASAAENTSIDEDPELHAKLEKLIAVAVGPEPPEAKEDMELRTKLEQLIAGAAAPPQPVVNKDLEFFAKLSKLIEDASAEPKPVVKEDLEFRAKLEQFTESRGRDVARAALTNATKIMQRLSQDVLNKKLHEMRRDVLERVVGQALFFAFEAAGFDERTEQEGSAAAFVWPSKQMQSGNEAVEQLKTALYEVQRAADLCLDPDQVSFAEVSELVQHGRTLPGIQQIDDKVSVPIAPKDSEVSRPRKPWEKDP